jgi:serine/threonine-protein kinase BUR1
MTKNIIDEFELLSKIGEGSYGDVYKALNTTTNSLCALKIFKSVSESQTKEFELQSKLSHPNILRVLSYSKTGQLTTKTGTVTNVPYMVMDLLSHGDLFTHIQKEKKYPESVVRHWFKQIVTVIEFMAENGVYH